jgi:hypothetical protein
VRARARRGIAAMAVEKNVVLSLGMVLGSGEVFKGVMRRGRRPGRPREATGPDDRLAGDYPEGWESV